MPNQNSNPDSTPDSDDPDLGFASDSHMPFGPTHRNAFDQAKADGDDLADGEQVQWTPDAVGPVQQPPTSNPAQEASTDPDDTWVPPEGPAETHRPEQIDPAATWVPPTDGAQKEKESPAEADQIDADRTWVPSSTPTADGISPPPENSNLPQDPNKTWVPSSTPTADGLPSDGDGDAVHDPNKTWTPSDTPTADGLPNQSDSDDEFEKTWVPTDSRTVDGRESHEDAASDPNRTWVPSSAPTADGVGNDGDTFDSESTWVMPPDGGDSGEAGDSGDPNKTWVPSTTPTASGLDQSDLPVDLTETVDVVSGAAPPVPVTGFEDTVDLNQDSPAGSNSGQQSTADAGDVFQKTIGMRRPLDSTDLPPSALGDADAGQTIHLDLPEGEMNRDTSHSTQLWARQSGANLNHTLTIRSRPVAGNEQFETPEGKQDKPDYQIVEKIGEGGMGAIFLANQTSLDRQLAIKTLKAIRGRRSGVSSGGRSSSVDRQRRDMFLAEALITANLVHPHIIPIHDLCETADGLPFYSMKRVVGTPWCDRIRDMDQDENLEVLMKVCDAIAYAHHNGVVNRDLKPENVMLGEFGEVLVLDWGLAVPSSAEDKKKFNSPSAPYGAGTPAYMAPELWTGPEEIIGYWSDIYLLGAILFEIITGKAPHKFAEPSGNAGNTGLWMVIDKVVRRNDIRETNCTGELMDIALKAMETRPRDRFASVLKFQEALKKFQEHEASRRLSGRAIKALNATIESTVDTGYLGYQSAAALFEEAQATWPENKEATNGLRETRLQYASLAHEKGDYDLGLQIAALEDSSPFVDIRKKLTRSRRIRNTLKSAVIVASAIVVAVGIFSFIQSREIAQQNQQIIALNGTRETLLEDITDAQNDIVEAEAKRQAADDKAIAAEQRAIAAAGKAEEAGKLVAAAELQLSESAQKLEKADARLVAASDELAKADQKLTAANKTLADTEAKVADLEVKKSRSAVDLKNAEIASLIRNGDYSSALSEVERLLSDLASSDEMAALPKSEQQQRRVELQARRRQLLRRAVQVKSPVQSQAVSRSGDLIVWGDQLGMLQVRQYSSDGGLKKAAVAELKLKKPAGALAFNDAEDLVLAADGSDIRLWNYKSGTQTVLSRHQTAVTAIRTSGDFAISTDEAGEVKGWSLSSGEQLWSMRSSSRILDLVLLPEDQMFIYAGSRGGESADILAYQLGGLADSKLRPERLGQLKLPRTKNDPPRALTVSPDGQKLLISNSRNGAVLVLPRRGGESKGGLDRFPFVHATELYEDSADSSWIADRHQRPVNQINFSADGKRFCTASDDRTIGIWEFASDGKIELIERLEGHGARVNGAAFVDTQGDQVASIAADRCCRFWNVDTYQRDKSELEREFQLSSSFSPSSKISHVLSQRTTRLKGILAAALLSRPAAATVLGMLFEDIQTADEESGQDQLPAQVTLNRAPSVQRGAIESVAVSNDGDLVITGGSDGTAVIWNTNTGLPMTSVSTFGATPGSPATFDEGHDFNVSRFQFLPPDGRQLLTTGFDGNLCVWNADVDKAGTGYQKLRLPGLGLVNALATSSDGQFVVTSSLADDQQPGICRVYKTGDLLNQTAPDPVSELVGLHSAEISAIGLNSDGSQVVTGGRDGRVALWSCADGKLLAASRIHTKNTLVSFLKLFDNGKILTAGYDGRLMLLRVKASEAEGMTDSFTVAQRFRHDPIPIERVAVHPDGLRFVTISIRTDKPTRMVNYELNQWQLNQPAAQRPLTPAVVENRPAVRVSSIDFSTNGSYLAAVVDQRLQIFDTQLWKVIRVVSAGGAGMSDAIFAPSLPGDGLPLRVATFDGVAAQLWDLDSGEHLAAFRPLFSVKSVARSQHDQPLLLTGDRSIRVFQASTKDSRFRSSIFKIEDPHSGTVNAIEFHPRDPDLFASCGTDGDTCLWKWDQKMNVAKLLKRIKHDHENRKAIQVRWESNGESFWVVNRPGRVAKYNRNGNLELEFQLPLDLQVDVEDMDIQPDARFVAVCGRSRNSSQSLAWIFQHDDSNQLVLHCQMEGHEAGGTNGIRFLKGSPYVVTAGTDGACLVWNWMPGRAAERPIQPYEAYQFLDQESQFAHAAPINALAVTIRGDVITAGDDGTARFWRNPFVVSSDDGTRN